MLQIGVLIIRTDMYFMTGQTFCVWKQNVGHLVFHLNSLCNIELPDSKRIGCSRSNFRLFSS